MYKNEIIEIFGEVGKVELKCSTRQNEKSRDFKLYIGNVKVAKWCLVEMPGCCAICVYTGAEVKPAYRNKGIGTNINDLACAIARTDNYTIMMATDITSNAPQQKIFSSGSWEELQKFINVKTNNQVGVYIVYL